MVVQKGSHRVRRRGPRKREVTPAPHNLPRRLVEPATSAGRCDGGIDDGRRIHTGSERDHGRTTAADQPRLPAPRLLGRGRGRRPGDLCPLVRPAAATAAGHRVARRVADDGRRPHLPRPPRLGTSPAGTLRGRVDPRAAARSPRVDQRTCGRDHGRPGRPGHARRVGQHGVPRRARSDDPGRTRRLHPPRRVPLLLRRSCRDRRAYACRVPPAGLVRPQAHQHLTQCARAQQPGRRPSCGTSSRRGRPRTSTP